MSDGLEPLLLCLGDGHRVSGTALARQLGISRAAVWKRIEAVRALGLDVPAQPGGGYRLARPIEWLERGHIQPLLSHRDIEIEVRFLVESTNLNLVQTGPLRRPRVLLAEGQTGGRGRRGRGWLSPPGGGVYLSLSWPFESGLTGLAALSLVAGTAAAAALRQFDVAAMVKWPNDLVVDDRKLGGCLVDISGAAEGPCHAVIGLGINVWLGDHPEIEQPWTDLVRLGHEPSRNALAAALINALADAAGRLERDGFGAFAAQWTALDALAGRAVVVHGVDGRQRRGIADGVDSQGRLRLIESGRLACISGGEVSVRRA